MDEVSLLVSQRVESLQVRALSSLDAALVLLRGHLHNGVLWANELWASERVQAAREAAERLHAWTLAVYLNAKESLSHVQYEELLQRLRQIWLAEVGGPRLQWCCLGAVSGCFVGLSLGITIGRRRLSGALHRLPGMRAIVCRGCHGIDGVTMAEDVPCPTISGPDQIIIQVRCASIDPADVKVCCGYGRVLRRHLGKYDPTILSREFPLVLGRDGSGVVVEVGDGVRGFLPGDEVWFAIPPWVPGGGSMSQLLMLRGLSGVDEKSPMMAATGRWGTVLAHKPHGVGFEGASTVPFSACLAWEAVTVGAKLGPENTQGKRVLVHGGTTGVGILLVQLLSAWRAEVVAVVGSRGAHLARRLLPSHNVLLYDEADEDNYLTQLKWADKFDVVFNAVGPIMADACMNSCREADPVRGILPGIVVTAYSRPIASDSRGLIVGAICSLFSYLRSLLLSSLDVDGRSVGWMEGGVAREALLQFGSLIESGRVIPVVGKVFPVGDAEMAFQHADSTDPLGKTVVRFSKVAFSVSAPATQEQQQRGGPTQSAWLLKE
ncbi:reticulon-4-interacting protein 1 homolog, mitochondrial-like isoform X2 [Ischnura elegans]|uniref:reticulon-4-interacting protein 1 homolog, mitochondrial-like isoform X2 n=1 Tax=Ischnura elegans TaxID=197161 RepID=UPI001ED87298|nr:reticulon-4-interacting protein 1 homolog, mitochondrial-like isoform X2 [Ischnura elegans]